MFWEERYEMASEKSKNLYRLQKGASAISIWQSLPVQARSPAVLPMLSISMDALPHCSRLSRLSWNPKMRRTATVYAGLMDADDGREFWSAYRKGAGKSLIQRSAHRNEARRPSTALFLDRSVFAVAIAKHSFDSCLFPNAASIPLTIAIGLIRPYPSGVFWSRRDLRS